MCETSKTACVWDFLTAELNKVELYSHFGVKWPQRRIGRRSSLTANPPTEGCYILILWKRKWKLIYTPSYIYIRPTLYTTNDFINDLNENAFSTLESSVDWLLKSLQFHTGTRTRVRMSIPTRCNILISFRKAKYFAISSSTSRRKSIVEEYREYVKISSSFEYSLLLL